MSTASIASFISRTSIFLPRYSGVRPTIRPGDEHRDDHENEEAVEARADAARPDAAGEKVEHRDQPPNGVIESCIVLTAPVLVPEVAVANSADIA